MASVLDALRGINSYPIPLRTIQETAERRGVDLDALIFAPTLTEAPFNLCRADLLLWLSYAPDVSQGGQSYSFTDAQRTAMRNEALDLYGEYGETAAPKTIYGYKGTRL